MFAEASELLFSAFCQALGTEGASVSSPQEKRALGYPRLRLEWGKVCCKAVHPPHSQPRVASVLLGPSLGSGRPWQAEFLASSAPVPLFN